MVLRDIGLLVLSPENVSKSDCHGGWWGGLFKLYQIKPLGPADFIQLSPMDLVHRRTKTKSEPIQENHLFSRNYQKTKI